MDIMKSIKSKPKKIILLLLLIPVMILSDLQVCAQEIEEGEGPSLAWKMYFRQRAYPLDSIPWGAYENAIGEKEDLRQTSGFQFSGPQT